MFLFFCTVNSWNPTILRLLLAGIFVYHGGQKAFGWFGGPGWDATIKAFTGMGLPYYLAMAGILAEALGALGLFLGFFTRLAALGIFGVMITAVAVVHWKEGFQGIEYPLTLAGVALALIFSGGGNCSLDKELTKQLLP